MIAKAAAANGGELSEAQRAEIQATFKEWAKRGVDISQLAAGLAAAIVGGDVNTAADAANSVVTNNALCAGFCIAGALVVIAALLETADKVLIAKDAYDLTQLTLECRAGSDAACQQARQTAIETGIVTAAEVTIGNAIPGSAIATKILIGIRKNVDPKTLERVDNIVENATNRGVDYPPLARPNANSQGNVILGDLDDLGRPSGATATITRDMIGTGSPANPSIRPPGFEGGASNHARGHLIANVLGGTGNNARNLVTLFQRSVNNPTMRNFETQVRNAVENGQVVNFRVVPIYNGSGGMPRGVTLTARGSGGFDLDLSIPNVNAVQ